MLGASACSVGASTSGVTLCSAKVDF